MRILFVASEVAPYSKTGGLGDVAGALPAALALRGHELTVVTPLYAQVRGEELRPVGEPFSLRFPFGQLGGTFREVRKSPGLRLLFVEQPALFGRAGIYQEQDHEYWDNHRRFAFLSIAALTAAQTLKLAPEILHLNDWQTGLAAAALAKGYQGTSLGQAKCVFTIHNLAYQGSFPKSVMDELGLSWELFTPEGLELHDQLSFLKAGLAFSDAITTVSRRYAQEIQTPEGGMGLDGFLRSRAKVLTGILNGADYSEWDPRHDSYLPARFGPSDLSGKAACKLDLLQHFGLSVEGADSRPLFGVVSRLADQKGMDILLQALPRVLDQELSLVVLGAGERRYEQALLALARRHPAKVGVKIGFEPALAHRVEAGSDFFLMPSRFEPCGLNQLYSLRYGAVPIVRAVGGLEDTVVDLAEKKATGIKFQEYSAEALAAAIRRALDLFPHRRQLAELRSRGMAQDFSWATAASQYEALYLGLLGADRSGAANPG